MNEYETLKSEIQGKMNSLREEINSIGTKFFKEQTARIFSENPNLKSFSWSQFTPYFNDGDECVFRVYDGYHLVFENEDENELDDLRDEYKVDSWTIKYYSENPSPLDIDYTRGGKITVELIENIDAVVQGIDEDVMKSMFGDHVTVIVSRDGVETEYYEHD